MTPVQLAKAAQFLSLIGGSKAISIRWVINNGVKNLAIMQNALQESPICLGIAVTDGWNQAVPTDPPASQAPQHAVMGYALVGETVLVYDHYMPYNKVLDQGYPIPYVFQGVVTPVFHVVQEVQSVVTQTEQIIPQVSPQQARTLGLAIQNLIATFLQWIQQ